MQRIRPLNTDETRHPGAAKSWINHPPPYCCVRRKESSREVHALFRTSSLSGAYLGGADDTRQRHLQFGRIDPADRKGPLNSTTRKVRCGGGQITLFEKLNNSLIDAHFVLPQLKMAFRSILSLDERVRSLI
ncbi:hypothetical protein L596_000574 [Steinernema carpocapsae]|uniref:Uncharacterized protein n=1 Tax=Steinernema carpocapsae TaxID=34508 RepID=A0A4V6YSS8_STECR|nr:hypothetical protein L596_000574 [Steinernema carpocapsae]